MSAIRVLKSSARGGYSGPCANARCDFARSRHEEIDLPIEFSFEKATLALTFRNRAGYPVISINIRDVPSEANSIGDELDATATIPERGACLLFCIQTSAHALARKMGCRLHRGYLLSPIQLIPMLHPGDQFLDDFLVLFLGVKLLQRITRPNVPAECYGLADAAEMQRRKKMGTAAAVVASVLIATLWLLRHCPKFRDGVVHSLLRIHLRPTGNDPATKSGQSATVTNRACSTSQSA